MDCSRLVHVWHVLPTACDRYIALVILSRNHVGSTFFIMTCKYSCVHYTPYDFTYYASLMCRKHVNIWFVGVFITFFGSFFNFFFQYLYTCSAQDDQAKTAQSKPNLTQSSGLPSRHLGLAQKPQPLLINTKPVGCEYEHNHIFGSWGNQNK